MESKLFWSLSCANSEDDVISESLEFLTNCLNDFVVENKIDIVSISHNFKLKTDRATEKCWCDGYLSLIYRRLKT